MRHSSSTLQTDHGLISISDTNLNNASFALLLLHGNSSSSEIWRHLQTSANLTSRWRIIAFDLPGHGSSSDAPVPERLYTQRG
jgi:pimeloyl-ACP methyl ester carboxylesterase